MKRGGGEKKSIVNKMGHILTYFVTLLKHRLCASSKNFFTEGNFSSEKKNK